MPGVVSKFFNWRNLALASALSVGTASAILLNALENAVEGGEYVAHSHPISWSHSGFASSLDHSSVRRGYEVYKQVCSACHSLKYIRYRHFVNVFMTEKEAKAEAAQATINDIGDAGQPITRPGMLNDAPPNPYPNDKAAAAANSGAFPPDLSTITLGRHGAEDYLFTLLTGYREPPAGVNIDSGKSYNPYFLGGVIAMPQQLFDDGIEFKDGTSATQAQQAKDVSTFLKWCAEPEHDERKKLSLKVLLFLPVASVILVYLKRFVWLPLKSRKSVWSPSEGRKPPPPPSSE